MTNTGFELRNIRPANKSVDSIEATDPYLEAWETWNKKKSPENMGLLLDAVDPVIRSAVRSYTTSFTPTIYGRARLMAAEVFPKYDPKRGKINTYLMNELRGLTRYAIKESQPIKLPERIMYDRKRLQDIANDFQSRNLREPTTEELADLSGLSIKRIEYIRKVLSPTIYEGAAQTETGEPIPVAISGPNIEAMAKDYVYHDLDPTDKLIFDLRFGAHGQPRKSVVEIANKLRISPAAVSQRAKKISQKILEVQQLHDQL